MKISLNWLKSYFKEQIPTPEKLEELFNFRFAEVDGIEKKGEDSIFDLKVLPDRAHYALCHRGVASEVSAITGIKINKDVDRGNFTVDESVKEIVIKNEAAELCKRYTGRRIENISVTKSPEWLSNYLESVGQRSINSIVDATNMTMLDMGQPLHAFDANKIIGGITIRMARNGEKITTLDGKEINLDPSILLIADDEGPLVIAGIKGGKRAEVDSNTKNLILESANFDASYVRKTSEKIGIKTDSSKRYENAITPMLAEIGSNECCGLINELSNKTAKIGKVIDIFPNPVSKRKIEVSCKFINEILGTEIAEEKIIKILESLDIVVQNKDGVLSLEIPYVRLDLEIPEDITDEVGRLFGYENIQSVIPKKIENKNYVLKNHVLAEEIRDILADLGFSELITSSFVQAGDHEIMKSASDKNFLRTDLKTNFSEAMIRNFRNADLLGIEILKVFEIGIVFLKGGEELHLSLGIKKTKKIKGFDEKKVLEDVVKEISNKIGGEFKLNVESGEYGFLAEVNLSSIFSKIQKVENKTFENKIAGDAKYVHISEYPFATRDISVFVPQGVVENDLEMIIKKHSGNLLQRITLFDKFEKKSEDGSSKISFAYRIVLQSDEKTLDEKEINGIMEGITKEMNSKPDWQVR